MAKMTEEQIKQAVMNSLSQADGYETGELAEIRRQALDYYYGTNNAAPHADGRSALQSSDLADMIESVTAQMMPAFSTDTLVEFEPYSDEDVDQAFTETMAVDFVVRCLNDGFYEIQSALKDALLLRNGVIKVWLDEQVDVQTETFSNLTDDEVSQLRYSPGHLNNLNEADNGFTLSITENDDGTSNATVKSKTTTRKIKVQAVDPVHFSWRENWDSIYLQDCPFVAERSYPSRSDLIEMGYPKAKVNKINAGGSKADYNSRYQQGQAMRYNAPDPSQDIIECYECYIRLDANGDKVGELLKVVIANETVLEWGETDYVPYASGTPFLQPHRFDGLSLFDKLKEIQDQKTHTLRQLADNQNHANNARVGALTNAVNMDDLTNSRPGGVVRINSPDALVPFPYTDIGPSCQSTLDYLDKVRAERGGASLDMIQADAQLAGDTAHGVERMMSAKEQMAAMMTRTLAETLIKTTYELVHTAMRLYVTDPIVFRTQGEMTEADPTQWPMRERVTVKAGLSNAERYRKKAALEQVIARQDALIAAGMDEVLVSLDNVYNAQADWARASGLMGVESYFTDPNSQQGQQLQQQKLQREQAQAEAAQAQQQQLIDMQRYIEERNADNADAKVIEDGRQHDEELQFNYWKENQEAALKEAEMTVDATLELVKSEGQDESTAAGGSAD